MDKKYPFGMTDRFLITLGFDTACKTLTFLGVEPRTLLDLGFVVVVDESGDVAFDHDDSRVGRLGEEPAVEKPKHVKWFSYPRRTSTSSPRD